MKKLTGIFLILLFCSSGLAAQDFYYVYEGERLPLYLNTEYAYLLLDGVDSADELEARLPDVEVLKFGAFDATNTAKPVSGATFTQDGQFWAEIAIKLADRSPESYQSYLNNLEERADVKLASPYFSDEDDGKIGISEFFVVRLHQAGDVETLIDMAKRTGTQIVGQNKFMSNWFTLSCNENSEGNALEMANFFAESGKFSTAQPDMMIDDEFACVNDDFFGNQWALDHTGQNGWTPQEDIHACDGWANWTTGDPDIYVCILDQGIEIDHPDLAANLVGTGWDSENGSSPATVSGNHGVACAGIAAAIQDNNIGVSGVCPDCGLLDVSNTLGGNPNSRQRRGDGINWAWRNGAVVVSNSWISGVQYAIIDDAIDSALTFGRDGLGTCIAFAAGNSNNAVRYPANSNPEILCVGAMSPCAERKQPGSCDGEGWGSCFGAELDIMAPGVRIPTTDRQGGVGYTGTDYTQTFNGTSSACPHVAGLVGLILSVNPCLDHNQVEDIIEQTAQKVGGYAYANTVGRPNGTWMNEMGYGLIDIDAAMQMAAELLLQNQTVNTNTDYSAAIIRAGENVDPDQPSGPFIIASPAVVTKTASNYIRLEGGFTVQLGATFTARIGDCSTSKMAPGSGQQAEEIDVEEPELMDEVMPGEFTVYPNPFRNTLTLSFMVERAGAQVTANLYNLQGREIATLIPAGAMEQGSYQKTLELDRELPAGVYVVRLCVDGNCQMKKMIKE